MWIFLSILILLIIIFGSVMLLRKIQYDYLHNNLLDLVDKIGGEVVRNGFARIPYYHGKYKGATLVINFTSARDDKGNREYYITYSYEKDLGLNFNIMSRRWLESHKVEENPDIPTENLHGFRISSSDKKIINFLKKNKHLLVSLSEIDHFIYLFSSVRGMMFEVQIPNFGDGSNPDIILTTLEKTGKLISAIKKDFKK